jgi:hypothetical protein
MWKSKQIGVLAQSNRGTRILRVIHGWDARVTFPTNPWEGGE